MIFMQISVKINNLKIGLFNGLNAELQENDPKKEFLMLLLF